MATQNERAVIDLVINGKQSEATLVQIKTATINATKALSRMAETDPGYAKQKRELEALMLAQRQRIVRINEEKTAWEKFKAGSGSIMSGVIGGNLVSTGLSALAALGPAVVDRSLKIKDSFADIGKAADMSEEEVSALNSQLKKIDTRTATEDLRSIVVVGGQFGVAKDQLEGFTESADKLNVALGDQFESVEKVAETTLTLRNTFQDIRSDNISDDMMKIGNGLNYLEAQGAATAPVMADFSSRIGGIAIPLGLTSGQVLGLSATLQELNVTAERGSSAVTDILSGITKAPDTFAKYARGVDGATLSSKEFKNLVNTDLNGALMAVIRGFKEGDTSATGMAAKLADMDIKGNGVMEIFMKLASNTDLLTQRQTQSADALSNTSSITAEFSKKNHELSVNLKKLGEWFDSFLENGTLMRFADGVVSITVKLLGLNNEVNKAAKGYSEQAQKVAELNKQMLPLIDRHDQLSKKAKLSATEQAELKKITAQVSGLMSTAVTQFDNYGVAVSISTTRVREMIEAQREMQKQMAASAKEEQQLQLRSLAWQREQILQKLKSGESVTVSASGNATASPLSAEDVKKLQSELKAIQTQTVATIDTMRELEGLEKVADRRKARRASETPADKPKSSQFGTAESEDEAKAREKKEKADERAKKKALTTAQRHEDQLNTLMSQARERTAKAEGDEFEKEQIAFGEHYTKLFELAKGKADKMAEITTLMYAELEAIEEKDQKRKDEKLKKQAEEDNKQGYDAALGLAQNNRADAQGPIDTAQAGNKIGEADARMQTLQADETFLTQKLLLEQTFAQESADTQRQLTENWNEQVRLRAQADYQYSEQMKQAEWSLQDAKRSAMAEGVGVLKGFLKEGTVAYKAAIVAQKAFAIAQVIVDMNREVAQIYANPAWSLLPDGGLGLKTGMATAARIRAGINIASIAATGIGELAQKDDGGFTGIRDLYGSPSGFVDQPTRVNAGARSYIVGEKRKEWIMGGAMLQNPVMANLAGALEALQQSGGYRNVSFASLAGQGAGSAGAVSGGGISPDMFMRLIEEVQAQRQAFNTYASRPVVNDFLATERLTNEVKTIRQVTGL